MDKKLLLGAGAALLLGVLVGAGLGGGDKKPSYADGRVNGCQLAFDALTGGAIQCENRKDQLHAVSPLIPGGVYNLDQKREE